MEQIELTQGSQEWHEHRACHFNASDAPAMMGVSPYTSRAQLLRRMATGITEEVDAATQRRFDDGHRFEALARPLAEKIIGKKLYPVIGAEGKLSASYDGLTADDSACFEHKSLNSGIREALGDNGNTGALHEMYRVQMEQQLMLAGASMCLFMASSWDDNNELVEELHGWYAPDHVLRDRLIQGWTQFAIDLEEYKRKLDAGEIELPKPAPKAEAIQALPSVFVHATGMVTSSNLAEFEQAALTFIGGIKTELVTDQDFADADAMVKFCKQAEGNIDQVKQSVTAQMTTVDEVMRTLDHIGAQLRDKRLMLDKLVKSEKETRRLAMVSKAREAFGAHYKELEASIRPITLMVTMPDFGAAIKGLKSLTSMQDALDTALANGKIEADAMARDIRQKLDLMRTYDEYKFLFADLQQIIYKPADDFRLLVDKRITDHKAAEVAKEEATRMRIEAEAKAKAEREAAEKLAAEEARIRAEEQEKARAEALANQQQVATATDVIKAVAPAPIATAFDSSFDTVFGKPTSTTSAPTLRLGTINERLGFQVTADFLHSLGFEAHQEKASKLYHEADFPLICTAIIKHINAVVAEGRMAA